MLALNAWLPLADLLAGEGRGSGVVIMVAGLATIVTVGLQLLHFRTEIHTFRRPRRLLRGGLFRISRNPIYLGFLMGLIGAWVFLGTLSPVVGPLLFFVAANYWYIPFEENMLQREFGAEYAAYRQRVRRWI
nr:methyltransferase [Lewinella sp. JB7]